MDDQTPSPDRSFDYALLRDPQLRDLFERADHHLAEARRLQAEIRRVVGAMAGMDGGDGPEVEPHVIIRKDPGRTARAKLNAADRPDEGLPS